MDKKVLVFAAGVLVLVAAVMILRFTIIEPSQSSTPEINPEAPTQEKQDAPQKETTQEATKEESEKVDFDLPETKRTAVAGGGGDGGAGGGGGGTASGGSSEQTIEIPEGTADFELTNFEYEIVNPSTVKISSISYDIINNFATMDMEILIYIYDDADDASLKGLVRDQIDVGQVPFSKIVSQTKTINAQYLGDLSTPKNIQITLIGFQGGGSFNLASHAEQTTFS